MNIDLSLSWVPSLNGDLLEPFPTLQELVTCSATPMPRRDTGWLRSDLTQELARAPAIAEILWHSVLMIWRLRVLEGDLEGAGDEFTTAWTRHLSAWLVSRLLGMTSGDPS